MYLRDGECVTKGQLLVALDKTDEATKVRQAELDLVSTQAKLSQSTVRRDEANRRYEQILELREGAYIYPKMNSSRLPVSSNWPNLT